MAIPIDVNGDKLFIPQNDPLKLIRPDALPVVQVQDPPISYDQWRDPYALNPPEAAPSAVDDGPAPTTASPSPSMIAPTQYNAPQSYYKYEPPPKPDKAFQPLMVSKPEYSIPEVSKYQAWKETPQVDTGAYDSQFRSGRYADAPTMDGGIGYSRMPQYQQNPFMVMPHMVEPPPEMARRVLPRRYR